MKKLLFAVFILCTSVAFATEADSIKVEKKKKEVNAEKVAVRNERSMKRAEIQKKFNKFSKDRFSIAFTGTNWIYKKASAGMNGLNTKWYSRGTDIAFAWDFRIKKSRFSIAPGIGYSCTNIYSRHALVEDSLGSNFQPLATPGDYKVNKITLQYLEIPVEFRIRTNPDKFDNCFKFAVGFKFGIRVDAHTKTKTKINNEVKVNVERRFPDFSLLRFGPTFRFGYSSFNITAYYGVIDVFKKGKGPKANEFSLGISFNGL